MSKTLLIGILIAVLLLSGCAGTTESLTPPPGEEEESVTPADTETTIDTTPPAEVSGLTATVGIRAVILTWEEPSDTDFAKVEIIYDGLSTPIEVVKGNTTTEITGLTVGVEYTFTVRTVDLSGNKSDGVEASAVPVFGGESLEYFPIREGHGIKYHVTDDYDDLDCNVWAVSQYFESDKPFKLDFVFTLIGEGTDGFYLSNSLGGDTSPLTCFFGGTPISNQGYFYMNFSLPNVFSSGDEWSIEDRNYIAEYVGAQTVNGIEFEDCIKVGLDDSLNDSEYRRGSGYFILARDVGIVQLVFNRTNGQNVLYEYIEHEQLTKHTISGTINDDGQPIEGILVQISNGDWGIRSVTDSNGTFSVQVYGPDIILRIGYDSDNDGCLDFDANYPRGYHVENITSDIANLSLNINTLLGHVIW